MASGRYQWPLQLLKVIWCLVFFSAGLSKLLISGKTWIFSDHLANLFQLAPFRYPEKAAAVFWPGFGTWLAGFPIVCQGLALGVVVMEVLAPLTLWSTSGGMILVALLAVAQVLIDLTLFENFIWFLPIYLVWLPNLFSGFNLGQQAFERLIVSVSRNAGILG